MRYPSIRVLAAVALLMMLPASATITTIDFDASSDTAIGSYTGGGSSWVYVTGSAGDMTVSAANDNVQCTGFSGVEKRVRYTGTGVTTGKQKVTLTVTVKNFNSAGPAGFLQAGADSGYIVRIATAVTNETQLIRINAGSETSLGTWDDGLTAANTYPVSLELEDTGSATQLTVIANGGTPHVVNDSSGSRFSSGYPGMYCNTDEQYVTLDDFILDDFVGGTSALPIIIQQLEH
jgi:hypothetical protein